MRGKRSPVTLLLRWVLLLTMAPLATMSLARPPAALAATNNLTLRVVSARAAGGHTLGEVVPNYKFIIVKDDTGDPQQPRLPNCAPNNPAGAAQNGSYFPALCNWPSIHAATGGAGGADNIVTQGDQSLLNQLTGIPLPNGKYFIEVTAGSFKLDGVHFTVPLAGTGLVTVEVQPDPLPLAMIKIQVFDDQSVNGQFDPPMEVGLAGFRAHISDVLGEVTTDWFGNPICTQYDAGGNPIPNTGGQCISDVDGLITIPNLGSNRYAASVIPPDGQAWVQTSTLEGSHDWDVWAYEGYQGTDIEMIAGGSAVPVAMFGYVRPTVLPACGTCAHITGRVVSTKSYLPPAGGDTFEGVVDRPWVALADLGAANDPLVYAGRGNVDGTYDIPNVPDGTYQVTFWDDPQNLLLALTTVIIANGQSANLGDFGLSHWFSQVHGTVFIDTNANGKQDLGEPGLANQAVVLKSRDNAVLDAGSTVATTDVNGHYIFPQVYPYGYWTVQEVYNDRFQTTGVTFQADNQSTETTVLGAGVDVAMLNQDGISTRMDWGVLPYAPGANGGIVGSVTLGVTRNELNPQLAATEDYEPGIPGLTVNLYAPVSDGAGGYLRAADGSFQKGPLLNTYVTETFQRPTDCQARDALGVPLGLAFAPPATGGYDCLEAPVMGNQVQVGFSTVNGNYGFGTMINDPVTGLPLPQELPLPPGDYLVQVQTPIDGFGRPRYQVVREEDINVFGGDQYTIQVPPPICAGALHTVHVTDPDFLDNGGSPYEGQQKPLCDTRLVTVNDARSVAPSFYFFTEVPLPGRLFGAVVEDLALSTDPQEMYYGEKAGVPGVPIGVYDFANRLLFTSQSDPNGFFEMLLPSTKTFNCPLPAGPCPNVLTLVGNDPGQPGHPNPGYNPQYRTFQSSWQIWPGITLLADVALLPNAQVVEVPGVQGTHPPQCPVESDRPQLFAVSQPYVNGSGTFTIAGQGFGLAWPASRVTLDGLVLPHSAWSDTGITVQVPAGTPAGPHQLLVTAQNGLSTVNGLTFHVLGGSYTPQVIEVGPGKAFVSVQAGLEIAALAPSGQALVVVYPNTPGSFAPLGDYYESVVMHSPVKLQGVGPGGTRPDGTFVMGSIVNGLGFASSHAADWSTLVESLRVVNGGPGWDGSQDVSDGSVIYVLARDGQFTPGYQASIDGFTIQGGNEFGPEGAFAPPYPVQGGGIFVNGYARNLQITNNVLRSNGGAFAGAIRIGTPYIGDNHNDAIRIGHNRILANGGSMLAGALGLFAGSNGYEVEHNDLCGNFSAEYGGAISHFGLSGDPATNVIGKIHHNRIYLNTSYDEGAGVFIAGEPGTDGHGNPAISPGSGPLDIYSNIIQSNLANDDGGGLRFLMAGDFPINVYNNIIANNVSAHEGAGAALDDATRVRFFNNTVMKNITTATAATSNGLPAPAGLSSAATSDLLQASLPPGSPTWSDPLLFNNIFWDNRAGAWTGTTVTGIGQPGDATPIDHWDMGFLDPSGPLTPSNSVQLESTRSFVVPSVTNKLGQDPLVAQPFDVQLRFLPWRVGGQFVFNYIVSLDVTPGAAGDYHLGNSWASPARRLGAASKDNVLAPADDIDGDPRPVSAIDAGADETLMPFITILPVMAR